MGITEHTAAANRAVTMTLPMHDRRDFDDARRGFVTSLDEVIIRGTDGRVVWDLDAYGSFDGDAPDTVHPSLWRQAQLNLDPRPVRGGAERLPGARPRPLEHDDHRGRRRA